MRKAQSLPTDLRLSAASDFLAPLTKFVQPLDSTGTGVLVAAAVADVADLDIAIGHVADVAGPEDIAGGHRRPLHRWQGFVPHRGIRVVHLRVFLFAKVHGDNPVEDRTTAVGDKEHANDYVELIKVNTD